jgi:serine O-acetyltransferase
MQLRFDPSREEFESLLGIQLALVGLRLDDVVAEVQPIYPRLAELFSHMRNKYFRDENGPVLRTAHNAQYTIFLYELSRAVFEAGRRHHADRIYTLLRMVSSVDLFYEVKLPERWGCDHPLGSVIGRGKFAPEATLFFSQNCNIGNNRRIFPEIAGNLHMAGNSSLLGKTRVTGNVYLANGACAIDAGDLSDCFVFGRSPKLTLKALAADEFQSLTAFTQ